MTETLVYVVRRHASGDSDQCFMFHSDAIDCLRRCAHDNIGLTIVDYETGKIVSEMELKGI